jgi:hypothetical protein
VEEASKGVAVFLWLFGDSIYVPVDECSGQIVAPGFSEKVFELVWNTSTSVVHEMMEAEGLAALEPCEKADVKDITHLTIRVSAGVGGGLQSCHVTDVKRSDFSWLWLSSVSSISREP